MTGDEKERVSFNVFKNIGSGAGAIAVTTVSLFLVNTLGGVDKAGFTKTAFIFAVVFAGIGIISIQRTRGYTANCITTEKVLMAIQINFEYLPLALAIVQMILMSFFSLDCVE